MRFSSWAALPLLSVSLLGCAGSSDVVDELAGESPDDDVVDGKADAAVDGSYTYYEVTADLRKCASPICGGFFLDRLNRSTTKCHDGVAREACYTPELDMTESGLSATALDKLVSAANAGALPHSTRAIVRGRFGKTNSTVQPELGRFIVTEVWLSESDAIASGVFVRVKDSGVRCIAAPCESTIEKGLNTSRSAMIADIDFTDANVTDGVLEQVGEDLFTPSGVIIAGDRYKFTQEGRSARGRTATAVYRRVTETAAGACFVGGCSSEVCSDQEGVVTTCDWHEEYACYQSATCERQGDGTCGFTPTPELEACLGGSAN